MTVGLLGAWLLLPALAGAVTVGLLGGWLLLPVVSPALAGAGMPLIAAHRAQHCFACSLMPPAEVVRGGADAPR